MQFFLALRARPLYMLLVLVLGACETATGPSSPGVGVRYAATSPVPARGTSSTLDLGTWNLEWFGYASEGPSNEALQLENIRDIMAGLDMDLWSVQEVVDNAHFDNLVSQMSGYDGFLANDPIVTDGAAYYSDYDGTEQKVGIIYKTSVATIQSAKVILKAYNYEFAGRPPVEVTLSATVNGVTQTLIMILLHAKAGSQNDDWNRRSKASAALKTYLDGTHPSSHIMVIGDFNDDVDKSITRPKDSPYKNFVDDGADYNFPTKALSDAGISSTVYYSDMVDHHLASNELIAGYVSGSAEVFPADLYVADYDQTTSDHYPVLTRFQAGSGSTNSAPTASFTYSCSGLTCSFTDSSTDSDGTIAARSWNFGDGATSTSASPTHTYGAAGTYTVSLTVTDDDGANGSTSKSVSVTSSGGGITLSATGYKIRGTQHADLTWSGATSTNVDVLRNGALIVTTANDGTHTDNINRSGGGSYTYKLCEAGSSNCSNEVTITF